MTPSVRAWLVLTAGIVGWDIVAPRGHTLSEQVDRWLISHPVITWTVGGIIFGHLLNVIPPRLDVVHLTFTMGRRWR